MPTLIIHALDDPFVPHATHFDYNWDSNPLLVPLMVECGGHNGFYGRDSLVPWHNRCAIEFLKNLEKQSNSRSLAISPVRQNS